MSGTESGSAARPVFGIDIKERSMNNLVLAKNISKSIEGFRHALMGIDGEESDEKGPPKVMPTGYLPSLLDSVNETRVALESISQSVESIKCEFGIGDVGPAMGGN